jgi:hypothetical protein
MQSRTEKCRMPLKRATSLQANPASPAMLSLSKLCENYLPEPSLPLVSGAECVFTPPSRLGSERREPTRKSPQTRGGVFVNLSRVEMGRILCFQ